jgi:hypothetical protein
MRRAILGLIAAVALTLGAIPTATAASEPSAQPPVDMPKAVAVPTSINGQAVVADESGCSDYTCISAFRTVANVVYVRATKRPGGPTCEAAPYHFHIWGPNINRNTELIYYCYQWSKYYTASPGTICAEGWAHVQPKLSSRGLACIDI